MNVEQIIKMIDAGYTKEEIEKMTQPEPNPEPEPKTEPNPEPEPKTEPNPEPEPKTEPKTEPKPADDPVLKELQDLKKAVYAMNIMQSSQPPKSASVDDILAKALKEE